MTKSKKLIWSNWLWLAVGIAALLGGLAWWLRTDLKFAFQAWTIQRQAAALLHPDYWSALAPALVADNSTQDDQAQALQFNQWLESILNLASTLPQTKVIQPWLDQTQKLPLSSQQLAVLAQQLQPTLQYYAAGQHHILMLLQNSNELRATGGFIGSYALITLTEGRLTDIVIEDIYDADGQFQGFVEAPAGAREYLSGGKGLRLPDSNWSPDFPTAATQILQYFALSRYSDIDTVIAITDDLVGQLIQPLGDIALPDYPAVNTQNLNQVLEQRGEFFAGSIRKKHLLNQAFTQISHQLLAQPEFTLSTLTRVLPGAVANRQLQIYSLQPDIQSQWHALGVSGAVFFPEIPTLMSIESNVGINKVNREIARTMTVFLDDDQVIFTGSVTHQGTALDDRNWYVNYQRILAPSDWQLATLQVDDQPPAKLDQSLISSADKQTLHQLGFLQTVKPAQTSVWTARFQLPSTQLPELVLPKQAGIDSVELSVFANGQTQKIQQDCDLLIKTQPLMATCLTAFTR